MGSPDSRCLALRDRGGPRAEVPRASSRCLSIGLWLPCSPRVRTHRYVATLRGEPAAAPARRRAGPRRDAARPRDDRGTGLAPVGAVDPKEILYALELLSAQAATRPRHTPRCAGCSTTRDADVRRRALAAAERGGRPRDPARAPSSCCTTPTLAVRTEALLYLPRHAARGSAVARPGPRPTFPTTRCAPRWWRCSRGSVTRFGSRRRSRSSRAMVAEAASPGARPGSRRRGSPSAVTLPFEESLRLLVQDEDPEVARTAIRAIARG